MSSKNIMTVVAVLVVCAIVGYFGFNGSPGGSKGSGAGTIAYLNHNDSDTFGKVIKDAFAKKAAAEGLNAAFYDAQSDSNVQTDQMNEAIANRVEAIVLLAVDADGIIPAVKKANDANIPVITLNRDTNGGEHLSVLSDDVEAGRLQGEFIKAKLPPNATIVYLEGTSHQDSAQKRLEGFTQACLNARPDLKLLSVMDGDYSRAEAMKIMSIWLSIFPKIDAVVAGNDEMALGAIASMKAANRLDGVIVSGVDATSLALDAIKSGELAQTVKQDGVAQAETAVDLALQIKNGNTPKQDSIIPFTSITKENIAQFDK